MKDTIKKSLISGIVFSLTVVIFGISYAAWTSISQVNTGDTLTASKLNEMITNQEDLKNRLDNLSTNNILQVVTNNYQISGYTAGGNPSSTNGLEIASISFTPKSNTSTILVQTSTVSIHEESNSGDIAWLGAWVNGNKIGVSSGTPRYSSFAGSLNFAFQSLNHSILSWGTNTQNISIRAGMNNPGYVNEQNSSYNLPIADRQIGITIMEIAN